MGGDTDQPGVEIAETISNTLMDAYMKPAEKGGVSELYIVYTEFINMVVQEGARAAHAAGRNREKRDQGARS